MEPICNLKYENFVPINERDPKQHTCSNLPHAMEKSLIGSTLFPRNLSLYDVVADYKCEGGIVNLSNAEYSHPKNTVIKAINEVTLII